MKYMKFGENLKTHNMSLTFFSTKDFLRCLNFTHVLKCRYNITEIMRLSYLETKIFKQLVCRRYASKKPGEEETCLGLFSGFQCCTLTVYG